MKFPIVTRSHFEDVVRLKDAEIAEKNKTIETYMIALGLLPREESVEIIEPTGKREVLDPLKPYALRHLSVARRMAEQKLAQNYKEKYGIDSDLSRVEAEGRASARGN